MASQSDWTRPIADSIKSYPGALRGYRNFLDTSNNLKTFISEDRGLKSVSSSFVYSPISEKEWWNASCDNNKEHDKCPDEKCTCGFYVNYQVEDTFYGATEHARSPRGVVEAAGKVVLGTKGFRAEKIRLVALAPIYLPLWRWVEEKMPHVELYDYAEDMYEEFPQEDLTSLIGEPKKSSLFEELVSVAPINLANNTNSWTQVGYASSPVSYNSYVNQLNSYAGSYSGHPSTIMRLDTETAPNGTTQRTIMYFNHQKFDLDKDFDHCTITTKSTYPGYPPLIEVLGYRNGVTHRFHSDGRYDQAYDYSSKYDPFNTFGL